ncbi:uncharacterized protein LOC126735428 isoform X2 [Anthonomus grandis grandis]|uniref:uncharacterized protein LOC126735428 isoform X2 n=1 Tax=Anthonomus grandis grandis TaxID=2921223 RepID=UPI002165195E|nr:uncharacterized protein LOC126735428 isoform X2 [Anthonomus grandis grandis]
MPPTPPFVEADIPGSTVAFSQASQLYTHSGKFPIERQITLTSTEKNFKIPILTDLKKRSKGSVIAPDLPPKRLTAWTNQEPMQPNQIYSDQSHPGFSQQIPQGSHPIQAQYRTAYYPDANGLRTPEMQRSDTKVLVHSGEPLAATASSQPVYQSSEKHEVPNPEEQTLSPKNTRKVSQTYHALKDIISGKFRGKDNEKNDNTDLNNASIKPKNVPIDADPTKINSAQVYPPYNPEAHHYNHQQMPQHAVQQAHQFYTQQLRNQQHQYSQLVQQRAMDNSSQYRQNQPQLYGNTFSRNPPNSPQQFLPTNKDSGIHPELEGVPKRRSAQQIERDNLKQKSLEARRTLSHPHLLLDSEENQLENNSIQQPVNVRRGSLGNILEANKILPNPGLGYPDGKESDDGGFLSKKSHTGPYFSQQKVQQEGHSHAVASKIETAISEPKRRTENEGERERASSNIDSGRGSAAYSSGRRPPLDDITDDNAPTVSRGYEDCNEQENDSEWVDIVEKELRHILEPKLLELSLQGNSHGINRSIVSGGSISSITPPLPPLSGDNLSPSLTPKNSDSIKGLPPRRGGYYDKERMHSKDLYDDRRKSSKYMGKVDYNTALRGKQIFRLESTDITSTTTRSLDLESILDGQSDSDTNLSAADTKAIRRQLEGLENMYSEVLKFLGVNKRVGNRYQPSDPRFHKKRHGSMSSLPSSSVSSVRRDRRYPRGVPEDRRRGREIPRNTNRRFQRLEAHVVTLARSVAHLSSEMRTQHLVVQEIESVRQEVAALRAQTNMLNVRSQTLRTITNVELPTLANPTRVKKLTKFFGDEPPLLRLFLRKLGYEKYANIFENEKIGMVELPYLSEERLQKMGIPLGPRLRIMQEAQISVNTENTLCII